MKKATPREPVLTAQGITKIYPGVRALDGVGISVDAGQIHGLVGENGAGKSTLVRLLGGLELPDAGSLTLNGTPYEPRTPQDALRAGVRIVHQELNSLANMSVAENLFLDHFPSHAGWVDRGAMRDRTREVLTRVGLGDLNPSRRMGTLSLAQVQLVEIARALTADAQLVILDEPTATLTPPERERLLGLVQDLAAQGVAIIYISHHLDEVFQVCDVATVYRNGLHIATEKVADLTSRDLVRMMVGHELAEGEQFPGDATVGDVLLDVQDLEVAGLPKPVSFQVRRGEILGVAGLVGAGRSETMRALFGADKSPGGTVTLDGKVLTIRSPKDAVGAGISFATEDRKAQGLILPMSCAANVSIAATGKVSRFGVLRMKAEQELTSAVSQRMRVKAASMRTIVGTLSGGNQQKVVLARWLFRNSDILIVDEPTRGIDVGARREIYGLLAELAREGKGIIMVSSDLEELMEISHRIAGFSRGEIVAEVPREEYDQEVILSHAYANFSKELAAAPGASTQPNKDE
jgi:ribose transport system ATP-binding protein